MPSARRAGRRLAALLVVLSVCCTPGHCEAAEEGSEVAQQIRELYAAHNPDKLPSIAALLSKYAGRERELLFAVRQKYADGAAPPAQPPSARPGAHAAPAPPRAQREPGRGEQAAPGGQADGASSAATTASEHGSSATAISSDTWEFSELLGSVTEGEFFASSWLRRPLFTGGSADAAAVSKIRRLLSMGSLEALTQSPAFEARQSEVRRGATPTVAGLRIDGKNTPMVMVKDGFGELAIGPGRTYESIYDAYLDGATFVSRTTIAGIQGALCFP